MIDTSPAVTRSSRHVNNDTTKMDSIPETAPTGNRDATSLDGVGSESFSRRSTMLKKKTKSEGINPLGLALVALILGCILGCPYNALDWNHLNYFDLGMIAIAAVLFCFMMLLVVLGFFGSDE